MATIETKYSVGDVVWLASTVSETKTHDCPDCNGERKWSVTSPAGGEYSIACPRCSATFMNDRDLSLKYQAHVPMARRLTIGSVRYDSTYVVGRGYWLTKTGGKLQEMVRQMDRDRKKGKGL